MDYGRTVLWRAMRDTRSLSNWRRRVVEAVVPLPGVYLVLRWLSAPEGAVQEVAVGVVSALVTLAAVPALEFVWKLMRAPARLHAEQEAENKRLRAQAEYFNKELLACVEQAHHPPGAGQLTNVPHGYKVASAEWLAQNPGIQKDLERCRAEVERLRKIIAGIPSDGG